MSAVTRRSALACAAAAALARPAPAAAAQAAAELTAGALTGLIRREFAAAYAYRASGIALLADQETAHALALNPHLEAVGTRRLLPPRGPQQLDSAAERLAAAAGQGERASAAIALEESLIGAYAAALGRLYDPSTVRTAATIMASHGQHLVRHHAAAGRDALAAVA